MAAIGAVSTFSRNTFFGQEFLFGMNLSGGLHFQPVLDCWWWCAITSVLLRLMLRPTCFVKKFSHRMVSWNSELVCESNAKS